MKSHPKLQLRFDTLRDPTKRIALVLAAYHELGYINRKSLMTIYGITQLQAGALMRDFIHAHAKNIEWNTENSHYNMAN
jgi:hypothetical protein